MGHYIDADRLRAEIERRKKEHMYDEMPITIGRYYEDRDLLAFIDSLQQEPVEKKTFDDYLKASPAERRKMNMTEILGAEKLAKIKDMMEQEQPEFPTTDEQVKEFLAAHPKIEVPEKYKNPDWLWKEKGQSEVDLEQEVISYFQGMWPGIDSNIAMSFMPPAILRLARRFYELGLNARKEE